MPLVVQAPDGALEYEFDWTPWLPEGAVIQSHQWAIFPIGPVLSNDTTSRVHVAGLVQGKLYELTDTVTLQGSPPRTLEPRAIHIRCKKGR